MLSTLAEKVDPAVAALIVVDVQNDFCHSDSPHASQHPNLNHVQETAGRIAALIASAREAGVLVVFVQNVTRPGSRTEVQMERSARKAPPEGAVDTICGDETWGSEFFCVAPAEGDLIVKKTRYSAFINTELQALLEARGIRTLIMTGVTTNTCVESTARDGFMLDFHVVMVDDCCGTYELHLHPATMENMSDRFGVVAASADLAAAWSQVGATPALAR